MVGVAVDQEGMVPEELARTCAEGAQALIVTNRAHNPTGAALSEIRAKELRRVLRKTPDLIIIEDDHVERIVERLGEAVDAALADESPEAEA